MTKKERAEALFSTGLNCAQSTCAPYAADMGMSEEDVLRMSAAFGGGIGRSGKTCGAVSGALMVLGMKYGPTKGDAAAKARMYDVVQEFMKRFEERHGALNCNDLVGADITTVDGRASMSQRNTHATVCTGLVADATAILDEMLKRP